MKIMGMFDSPLVRRTATSARAEALPEFIAYPVDKE